MHNTLNHSIFGCFVTLVGLLVIALVVLGVVNPTPQIGFGLALLFGFSVGWQVRNLLVVAENVNPRSAPRTREA
jgi:hypothetical protein